jgi:hypothetical protein
MSIINSDIVELSKMPQRGKAMKPGIKVMEPKKEAIITPLNMLLLPR